MLLWAEVFFFPKWSSTEETLAFLSMERSIFLFWVFLQNQHADIKCFWTNSTETLAAYFYDLRNSTGLNRRHHREGGSRETMINTTRCVHLLPFQIGRQLTRRTCVEVESRYSPLHAHGLYQMFVDGISSVMWQTCIVPSFVETYRQSAYIILIHQTTAKHRVV